MRRLLFRRSPARPATATLRIPAARRREGRVLGIDPGTLKVGYAVLETSGPSVKILETGVIRPRASDRVDLRLGFIHERLEDVLERFHPAAVALEAAFYGKSASASLRIGEGRGAAMVAAAGRGIPVHSYPPARVKKAVTGTGQAGKGQVQAMVRRLLRIEGPLAEDAADALAVALCHLHGPAQAVRGPACRTASGT